MGTTFSLHSQLSPSFIYSLTHLINKMTTEAKLFGKWPYEDLSVGDLSLVDYIAVKDKACVYTPHTSGRYQKKRFRKALCPIVERLVNSMMMHGRNNGKKLLGIRIVRHAFEIIHLMTDKNPGQVFVEAVKNG